MEMQLRQFVVRVSAQNSTKHGKMSSTGISSAHSYLHVKNRLLRILGKSRIDHRAVFCLNNAQGMYKTPAYYDVEPDCKLRRTYQVGNRTYSNIV
jgi:hypothetical protein